MRILLLALALAVASCGGATDTQTKDDCDTIMRNLPSDQDIPAVREWLAKSGNWDGSNNLGVSLPFDISPGHPQTVLRLPTWGFPTAWQLILNYRLSQPLTAHQAFDAVGLVSVGSGGCTYDFEADWGVGTVIPIFGNALDLRASWDTQAVDPPSGVQISALLARGSSCRTRATRTQSVSIAGKSVSDPMAIPVFAKGARIVPVRVTDVPLVFASTFFFFLSGNSAGTFGTGAWTGDVIAPDGSLPVPQFAKYWQVANDSTSPLKVAIVWDLFDD